MEFREINLCFWRFQEFSDFFFANVPKKLISLPFYFLFLALFLDIKKKIDNVTFHSGYNIVFHFIHDSYSPAFKYFNTQPL